MTCQFIPNLSTPAGSCLTMANWQEVGVFCVAYDLEALLVKPGMDVLYRYPNLASYVGWPHQLILNATSLRFNEEEKCHVRSHFNGERFVFDWQDVRRLIQHLGINYLLIGQGFPQEDWQVALLPPADLSDSLLMFESKNPVEDALNGKMYVQGVSVSLLDESERTVFEVLDKDCRCPTCQQGLTRAYLHHLYTQTPLLCQRLLIQHNVFQSCHLPSSEISL